VVVDEASMVATADLDRILTQASTAGAKVVLVGDHHQLGAVGAGGAFGLLADTEHAQNLTGLWRFKHRWEAEATRALRTGRATALDAYAEHGRLQDGPAELMLEAAYTAWATDIADGHVALLLAADRAAVAALNTRAHDDRVAAGLVEDDGVALADDSPAGRGDIVVTRRNNRALTCTGGHVRNGSLWRIDDVHPDGSLDVTPIGSDTGGADGVRLPAAYVRDHVELGYASTVHRAQGMTVDRCHILVTGALTRQSLYVAMTRGKTANHAWISTDSVDGTCPTPDGAEVPSGRDLLRRILTTDGSELSATASMSRRQDESTSLRRLLPIRELVAQAGDDPETELTLRQLDEVIRLRAIEARNHRPARSEPVSQHQRQEGLHR
jgi:ATP-dependent exoDNAse (exonuclease V) alpha subunit